MEPQLNTITIVVNSLPKALQFYRALGLKIPIGQEQEYYVECVSKHASTIVFITKENMLKLNPSWRQAYSNGNIGLHFKFSNKQGVEETYNKLMDLGYQSVTIPYDTKWGERFAEVLDPDGNTVSIFAPLMAIQNSLSLSILSRN